MNSGSSMKTSYYPGVEAISPVLPSESQPDNHSAFRTSKNELLLRIDKIDREIQQVETQIGELKERKKQLELKSVSDSKDLVKDTRENVENSSETRQLGIVQRIYSENRKKAREAHEILHKLGPTFELPLYNQPSDSPVYHKNKEKFKVFKPKLINYFKRRNEERKSREKHLLETYDKLMAEWLKKLEKNESNPNKRARDNKTREFFEKQFSELRKQRENRERLSKAGQRIRSDADIEEIMDGLQEKEIEDVKMRSSAVIPPMVQDEKTRKYKFINLNGLVENPLEEYKQLQLIDVWLDHEKEIFKEKFLQNPKNFGLIASYLERKTVPDCVHYYYLSKKRENYKQLLRKQVKKRTRALVKQQQQQQAQQQAQQASQQQTEPKEQADELQVASAIKAPSEPFLTESAPEASESFQSESAPEANVSFQAESAPEVDESFQAESAPEAANEPFKTESAAEANESSQAVSTAEVKSESFLTESTPEATRGSFLVTTAPEINSESSLTESAPEAASDSSQTASAPEINCESFLTESAPEVNSESALNVVGANEIRVPRFNPHPYIKPEGLALMAMYPPSYSPRAPDYEIQDLSKKSRKLEESYYQSNLPPIKRERFDSPPNIRGNEFKNYPVHPNTMIPTPPPAHSNQLKRMPIPVPNLSSENAPMSSRHIEPPRIEESGYSLSNRPGFNSMMVCRPSGSPLITPTIRTPISKLPLSSSSPVIHTPPPPLIASNKSYPFSSGSQLSPQSSYRDKVIPSQIVPAPGSITQGTPIIMNQHGQLHSNQYNQNRYEGLFRQLTPTYPKDSGSITLGTPVTQDSPKRKNELPMRHDCLSKPYGPGVYDTGPMDPYYRRMPGSNMSFQPPNQSQFHSSPINFPRNEGHMKPRFQVESQSSMNQIIIDFNTSKQMQPRQTSSADVKEPHSISSLLMRPTEANPHMSPQGRLPSSIYPLAPPTNIAAARQSVIHQYNSGCKQSVIQNVKSSSRFATSSPSYFTSYDAFQTLVDAAVAQKSLSVPPTSEDQQHMRIVNLTRSDDPNETNFHDLHQRSGRIQDMSNLRFGMNERLRLLEADKRCLMPRDDPLQQTGRNAVNPEDNKSSENKYLPGSSESSSPRTCHRLPFTKESFEKKFRHQDTRLQDSYQLKPTEPTESQNNQPANLSKAQLVELGDIEASRIFSQSFQKDENPRVHCKGEITAANLIDAIITHQINQSSEEGPGKEAQHTPNTADNKTSELRPVGSTSVDGNAVSFSMDQQNEQEKEENIPQSFEKRTNFDQVQQQAQQQPINQMEKDDPTSSQNFRDHIATIISKSFSNNSKVTPIAQPVTIIPYSQENTPSQIQPLIQMPVSSLIQSNRNTVSISRPNSRPGDSTNTSEASSQNPHSDWKLRKALQQQTMIENENNQASTSSSSNNLTSTTTTAATTTTSSSMDFVENRPTEPSHAESPYRSGNWMSNYNFEPISPPSPKAGDDNDDK